MGLILLLKFALVCVDFLAWPVIALGYPLFASIRAIETGSMYHMRKLIIYWTLFSIICLFEYVLVKAIEWIPFWSSIKLIVIFWLVIPRFHGACYAYQSLIRSRLVVNLQEAINRFDKLNKVEQPRTKEMSPDLAEKYIQENGFKALEKLIASKMELKEPDNSHVETKFIEQDVKNVVTASKLLKEPVAALKDEEMLEAPKKVAATEVKQAQHHALPVAGFWVPKGTTYAAAKAKDTITPTETTSENKQLKVQPEWICSLCQVTATCENDLNNHLHGKKHKSMCESLKSSKLYAQDTRPSSTCKKPEPEAAGKNKVWRRIPENNLGKSPEYQVSGNQHY